MLSQLAVAPIAGTASSPQPRCHVAERMFVRAEWFTARPVSASSAPSDDLRDEPWLAHIPADRRAAVLTFVHEHVGTCPYCQAAILRSSSRGVDKDERLGCFGCVTETVGKCSACNADITRQHRTEKVGANKLAHADCSAARRQMRWIA